MFEIVKKNTRLWVRNVETGELVYSPPDFIQLQERADLYPICRDLNAGVKPIVAIIAFESWAFEKGRFKK